jgi:methylthioribulose-1-phosphate dehydratase
LVYLAPSGVAKELMQPENIYVLSLKAQEDPKKRIYLRSPPNLKPSQCTPLFITLLLEQGTSNKDVFEINNIEQIKAFGKGFQKEGSLGYHDTLRIPVIENTPHEEDLRDTLEQCMDNNPDTYAVLVRRHGVYVWGETVHKAKTQAERCVSTFRINETGTLADNVKVSITCSSWRSR